MQCRPDSVLRDGFGLLCFGRQFPEPHQYARFPDLFGKSPTLVVRDIPYLIDNMAHGALLTKAVATGG